MLCKTSFGSYFLSQCLKSLFLFFSLQVSYPNLKTLKTYFYNTHIKLLNVFVNKLVYIFCNFLYSLTCQYCYRSYQNERSHIDTISSHISCNYSVAFSSFCHIRVCYHSCIEQYSYTQIDDYKQYYASDEFHRCFLVMILKWSIRIFVATGIFFTAPYIQLIYFSINQWSYSLANWQYDIKAHILLISIGVIFVTIWSSIFLSASSMMISFFAILFFYEINIPTNNVV